jgi:DNA-binding NtrC family response regulator
MNRSLALVADRDATVRAALRELLEERQVMTLGAAGAADALEFLAARPVGLIFVDLDAGGALADPLISRARRLQSISLIIGLTAAGPETGAHKAAELGLFDVLDKPLAPGRLRFSVDRALRQMQLLSDAGRLREALQRREGFRGIVGRSAAVKQLREQLDRLAPVDLPVWISGEEGSGKSLAARTLHDGSARAARPFVAIDCQALSREEWRAQWSPGVDEAGKPAGLLLQARGGTLYLERATSLHPDLQEELAGMLGRWEDGQAGAAGAPRLLAGSVEQPAGALRRGLLLPSLHQRMARATLHVPALRERMADIAPLCRHFVTTICEINQLPAIRLSADALAVLERYRWPANVRELRQAVEHAVILASEGMIRPEDLPEPIREGGAAPPAAPRAASGNFRAEKRLVVDAFERTYLTELLTRHAGNVTLASQQAGMLRSALQRLLRKHGLRSADFRKRRAARPRRPAVEKPLD